MVALAIGVAYLAVTPPFQVPDENAHYWRAIAIANGHLMPPRQRPAVMLVPRGYVGFLWHMLNFRPGQRGWSENFEQARQHIPLDRADKRRVDYPAFYSPVPYMPQAVVVAVAQRANAKPVLVFYLGRTANLLVAVLVIALAIHLVPRASLLIAAVSLLPMALFLFGSWSADAITIALAILVAALWFRSIESREMVTVRETVAITIAGLALALCKPVYFLLGLTAFAVPGSRFRSRGHRAGFAGAAVGATVAGTLVAAGYARSGFYNIRADLPVDPSAQLRCMASDPIRFLGVLLGDLIANGRVYIEGVIGRLGWNDLKLPAWLIVLELLVVLIVALSGAMELGPARRIVAIGIAAATVVVILVSQYLVWSIICGDKLEGVQGRYFVPIAVLALGAVNVPRSRVRIPSVLVIGAALIGNLVALSVLVNHYW